MVKTIVRMKFGSHLYGLDTPQSDLDFKEVYIQDLEGLLTKGPKTAENMSTGLDNVKNLSEDIDLERFSLHKFLDLANSGQMIAIDMLHAPLEWCEFYTPEWEYLHMNRQLFYTADMNAYMGYLKKQVHKYGVKGSRLEALKAFESFLTRFVADSRDHTIGYAHVSLQHLYVKYPEFIKPLSGDHGPLVEVCGKKYQYNSRMRDVLETSIAPWVKSYGGRAAEAAKNEGVDWKAVSHACRAGYQLLEIYRTGDLKYPLSQGELLLNVKQGKMDFKSEVEPLLEDLVNQCTVEAERSELPDVTDRDSWERFGLECYQKTLKLS